MSTSFGPSALATPANAVTMARVAVTPVLLVWILGGGASWPALVMWIALASTDGLDGYIARRHGTTRSGAFLDPLADKFLVIGALVSLVVTGVFWWLPVAIIAAREIFMSVYRSWVARRGVSIPARGSAKIKTVVQIVAVALALFPPLAGDPGATWLTSALLWIAVALTVFTGAQYLIDGQRRRVAV